MPELESITVKGFKSIASVESLKLGAINVVVGPNGSGKSNFIGVFSFLNAIRAARLQDYIIKAGGADRVLHFGAMQTRKIGIRIVFRNERNQCAIDLEPTDGDELVPSLEVVHFWDRAKQSQPYSEVIARAGKEAGIGAPKGTRVAGYVRDHLDRWRLYHFQDTGSTSP
ncbi:AAA family ATPase [Accumulibacter sp.]|uniref:AAA family ATPase n=1 Tax=Accumulibacter sp. TaxID=2053492 RepID=UPI0025F2C085|nr:AAA family ATPase [Accumulibacter sp.]MCM8612751.1 AAA family ATPase [Accumulibacter sp.]MCM8637657.1 AAA family ATPase [Accumulibacter sp.]MCM8639684.1 AAA family ATPase [Accumulibacter sp.]